MLRDSSRVEAVIDKALGRVFPAAQVVVRAGGETRLSRSYGWLDPETMKRPTGLDTLFDLASVTKLFVVTAFMASVEDGLVGPDDFVSGVLPEFDGERPIQPYDDPLHPGSTVSVSWEGAQPARVDAGRVTFRHLLTHSSGLPAWRPLFKAGSPEAARRMALTTGFSYPIAARTIYSDIGLILLGMAIERLTGLTLDEAVYRRVTEPLGLAHTHYAPLRGQESETDGQGPANSDVAPTEFCAWRRRRIVAEVHDENAAGLGGVAGHAGLFSTASDLAAFGESFLSGPTLLRASTIAEMTRLQARVGATRRGLGFALWSPDPEASGNPFSQSAFGHTGFTGTSLWIDPQRDLVVAVCTNRVYYGRDAGGILAFRVALHRAIVEAL